MPTTTFPPPLPHGPIEELFPDVFLVRGSFRIAALTTIGRNMVVLREGSALTLVSPVRLSAEGEAELARLGEVKHVVKLGHFHGVDDPYYRDRYRPTYWAPRPKDGETRELATGGPSPVSHASPFRFDGGKLAEAALLVERAGGNLLVTCDSVQNWESTEGCSIVGALAVRAMGFLTPAKIGPIWLKEASGGQPAKMREDFDRLLALDFAHLVAGHGTLLRDRAKEALARSCDRTLGPGR